MTQHARLSLRFMDGRPQIVVAEPYYTPVSVVQTAAGALGAFGCVIGGLAGVVGQGLVVPLLGMAVVCLLFFIVGELTLVRTHSAGGRLAVPDSVGVFCRIGRHDYHPQGMTTEDQFGRTRPPQMAWTCARCGDEQWLTPGRSPDSRENSGSLTKF